MEVNLIYFQGLENKINKKWIEEIFRSNKNLKINYNTYSFVDDIYKNPIFVVDDLLRWQDEIILNDKPFILIHIGDKFLKQDLELYYNPKCLHVFRNYYNPNIKNENITYFPVGYEDKFQIDKDEKKINIFDRKYNWSFFGDLSKFNRKNFINYLQNVSCYNYFNTKILNIKNDLFLEKYSKEIYLNSKMVPCLRGDSIETSKIYNALENGCIPIVYKF